MTNPPQGTTPSTELLHEHFYKWLEASGVVLDDQLDSGEWRSNIDLNKLKTAILTEVTQERNKAWEEATAKFEACRRSQTNGLIVGLETDILQPSPR